MRIVVLGVAIAAVTVLSGCESTKHKSARLAKQAKAAVHESGVRISSVNRSVAVVASSVIHDANGTAAVVTLRNRGRTPQLSVPIVIDVQGKDGRSVFRNDTPGLDASLTSLPAIAAGAEISWVNDQITASAPAETLKATVGSTPADRRGTPVELPVSGAHLQGDASSGIEATGTVDNTTAGDVKQLVLYVVARRGTRVVAAGRAIVPRLAAGKSAVFHAFFIGDPRNAALEITAPAAKA